MADLRRRLSGRGVFFAGWLLFLGGSVAKSVERSGLPVSQISFSGRFSAHGPVPAWNLKWLIDAEALTSRIEGFVGKPLPGDREFPLRLVVQESPLDPPAVRSQEMWDGGYLRQRILVQNPASLDPRLSFDHLTGLILARYVRLDVPLRKSAAPTRPIPAWFSVGVSEYLSDRSRSEMYQTVSTAWIQGKLPSSRQIFSWFESIPSGDLERSVCAVTISWLRALPNASERLASLMQAFAKGEIQPESIWASWLGSSATEREAEIQWNLWISSLDARVPGILMDSKASADAIRKRVELPRSLVAAADPVALPERITPQILLAHRGESWVRPAALRMTRALSYLSPMILPAELREVRNAYLFWLACVATPEPSLLNSLRGQGVSRRSLQRNLTKLEETLLQFQQRTADRKLFLDQAERVLWSLQTDEEARQQAERKAGIKVFLDELESTLFFSIGEPEPGR